MLASLKPLALRIYIASTAHKTTPLVFKVIGPFSDAQMDSPNLLGQLAFENLHIPNVRPASTLSFTMATRTFPSLRAAVDAGVIQILELDHYQRAKHCRIVDRYYASARAADKRMERDMRFAAAQPPVKHPWAESLAGLRTEVDAVDVQAGTPSARTLIDRIRRELSKLPNEQWDKIAANLEQLALSIGTHTKSDFAQGVALPPVDE